MLAVIWIWLFIMLVALTIGTMAMHGLAATRLLRSDCDNDAIETFFAGLCLWGAMLNAWSLVGATNIYVAMASMGICIVYIAKNADRLVSKTLYPFYQTLWHNNNRLVSLAVLLCVGLCAVIPPNNYDAGLYHIPAIRWIEQYAVVPGLGNLHGRFAFNPSVFMLTAATDGRAILGTAVYALNSVLLLVFLLWVIGQIHKTKNVITAFFYAAIVLVCLIEYVMQVSAPTPDIASTVLSCFVLLRVWERRQVAVDSNHTAAVYWGEYLLLVIIICYVLTVKLSAVPLLLLIPYLGWVCRKTLSGRAWVVGFALGIIILVPWLARNVILSGYLVYPVPIDLFDVDWKVPLENVIDERNWIYSWARIPNRHWSEVLSMPFSAWLPIWFVSLKLFQKFICIFLFVVSPAAMAFFVATRRSIIYHFWSKFDAFRYINTQWIFVWIISYIGYCYWFLTAPSFRFGSAFVWLACLLPMLLLRDSRLPFWLNRWYRHFIFSAILLLSAYYYMNVARQLLGYFSWSNGGVRATAYSPADYLLLPLPIEAVGWRGDLSYQTHHVGSIVVLTPINDNRCFDSGLPCTPCFNSTLAMRGNSIAAGFRVSAPRPMVLDDF